MCEIKGNAVASSASHHWTSCSTNRKTSSRRPRSPCCETWCRIPEDVPDSALSGWREQQQQRQRQLWHCAVATSRTTPRRAGGVVVAAAVVAAGKPRCSDLEFKQRILPGNLVGVLAIGLFSEFRGRLKTRNWGTNKIQAGIGSSKLATSRFARIKTRNVFTSLIVNTSFVTYLHCTVQQIFRLPASRPVMAVLDLARPRLHFYPARPTSCPCLLDTVSSDHLKRKQISQSCLQRCFSFFQRKTNKHHFSSRNMSHLSW